MKQLLMDAQQEILHLRRDNEVLRAKVETMELFACVLHTQPARAGRGEAPDVAWALQRQIDDLTAKEAEFKDTVSRIVPDA